ncbi:MAG: hypothetical protein LBP93_03180 [Treponema sp.]|jgi:hypothetical protein|nr:hypothetical protein [Treponema sp.]
MKKKILGLALMGLVFPWLLFGADQRNTPIDMYLIFDGSSAIKSGRDSAINWLCDTIVEGLLREGDTLNIWLAADRAEEVFSGPIGGADQKEQVKTKLRALSAQSAHADYAGALRAAEDRQKAAAGRKIAYTLLISGPANGASGDSTALSRELAGLLR